MRLQLWDTAGQERFRSVARMYYKNAHAVIVMFDLTSPSTFESVPGWFADVRQYVFEALTRRGTVSADSWSYCSCCCGLGGLRYCPEDVAMILVGNKVDLPRAITPEQALVRGSQAHTAARGAEGLNGCVCCVCMGG